jgi:ParB family chromosome partitioning protein
MEGIPESAAQFAYLPIASIQPNAKQPRHVFDPEAMDELVHSITEIGLLQPVVVRPIDDGRYELIAGERRLRASTIAGQTSIPAIIRVTDDGNMLRDALLENLHRADLNPLEEAAAYQQMLDDFGCTQEQLATRIGRSRPQVTNTLRLLRLPASVQKRVAAGVLSAGHARALLALNDDARAEALAARIVAEGLSVRSVEEIISSGATRAPKKKSPAQRTAKSHADFLDAAQRLEDLLDTQVTITYADSRTAERGDITIRFADVEDLHRIISVIAPHGE